MTDTFERLKAALADRYAIERELGAGGMATVYLAQDLKHHRKVAVKVLRPELAATLGPERFVREIEIAANLTHPHILPLFDSGEADGFLYYVMPYIEGESLRERLDREAKLSVEDGIRLTDQVGSALSYAHEQGVVHRDIKPENILLAGDQAIVADFGIARAVQAAGGEKLTGTGFAIGTPDYMSPEQAMGQEDVDGRSDVYSLGCVVFEAVSGRTPFDGSTPQALLAKHAAATVPRLRASDSAIPVFVERAVEKALAKIPADRFQTPTEFVDALTTGTVVARTGQRYKQRLTVAAAAVVVASLGGWWLTNALGGSPIERLAVLPASNMTRDPEQDYFVDGVHEALVTELQRAGISVIARQSVLQYRDTEKPIRTIAEELGVDALIQPSVGREGASVVVDVSLYDGRTQLALWSQRFNRPLEGVLRLYRDVSRSIADEVGMVLSSEVEALLDERPALDLKAYDAYLRGRFHLRRFSPQDFTIALESFESALDIDPDYAPAHVGVALAWMYRRQAGLVSFEEARPHFDEHLDRALELDPELAETHHTVALKAVWVDWNWEAGEAAFQQALDLDPDDAETHMFYGHLLTILGRWDQAAEQVELALELDRLNPFLVGLYGAQLTMVGRTDDVMEILQEMRRNNPGAGFGRETLADAFHEAGRDDEALALWRESADLRGEQDVVAALDLGRREGGYTAAFARMADTMAVRARETYVPAHAVAEWYMKAGEREKAVDWLEIMVEQRNQSVPYIGVSRLYRTLHDHRRFQALVRRVGVPLLTPGGG